MFGVPVGLFMFSRLYNHFTSPKQNPSTCASGVTMGVKHTLASVHYQNEINRLLIIICLFQCVCSISQVVEVSLSQMGYGHTYIHTYIHTYTSKYTERLL